MKLVKPNTVEGYIAGFPDDIRQKLEQLREVVKQTVPDAEEMISYNMPLYKWKGMLISFAAWKSHIAVYPMPAAKGALLKKLSPFQGAKSTLRFPLHGPLPLGLIIEVIKLRMKENLKAAGKKQDQ